MLHAKRQILLRAAVRLAALLKRSHSNDFPELPTRAWQECVRRRELWQHALSRNWSTAAEWVRGELERRLRDLRRQLASFEEDLIDDRAGLRPTTRELYDDLCALDEQFDELEFDDSACEISAVTDSIVLDGFGFGSFRIVLDGASLTTHSPRYRVIAVTPQPAATNSDVTHPHVNAESLCEGDARAVLRRALADGRLLDFFTIVAQTLATYNPSSAYVTVERWEGITCRSCGDWADEEDASSCERCGDELCSDCATGCDGCSQYVCGGCSAECPACQSYFCDACLVLCEDCHERFCSQCLDENRCPGCREAAAGTDENSSIGEEPAGAVETGGSTHALRLGEARLAP